MTDSPRARRDQRCRATAAAQLGLLNRTQALAAGHNNQSIHVKLRNGEWRRMLRRVYRLAGTAESWRQKALAAHLSVGERSALSFTTAAALRGYEGFARDGEIHISTTQSTTTPSPWIVLHRVDGCLLSEIEHLGSLPVTSARRTLLDLAGAGDRRAERALDAALRVADTSVGDLALMLDDPRLSGRRGVARLGAMLVQRDPRLAPTDSDMEDLAIRLLRSAAIPLPQTQWPEMISTGPIRIDLAYPEIFFGIELDSAGWHLNRRSFEADRLRDAELSMKGWTILRFTWSTLCFKPEAFVSIVRQRVSA